jgi:hypothetical protein
MATCIGLLSAGAMMDDEKSSRLHHARVGILRERPHLLAVPCGERGFERATRRDLVPRLD